MQEAAKSGFGVLGEDAKDLENVGNLQIDKFGYQLLNIAKDRVTITFPDGNTVSTPTDYLQKVILTGFNQQ